MVIVWSIIQIVFGMQLGARIALKCKAYNTVEVIKWWVASPMI